MKKNVGKGYIATLIVCAAILLALCVLLWSTSFAAGQRAKSGHVFPVYISEVLANNTRSLNQDGLCCDYIELYNSSKNAMDLSHYQLRDGSGQGRYLFPEGTVIEPGDYLVVYCDPRGTSESYASFGLSRDGETLQFLSPKGILLEQVALPATIPNQSFISHDDGSWSLTCTPTPGQRNQESGQSGLSSFNAAVSPLRITEVMTDNLFYRDERGQLADWIELYNTSSAPLDIAGYCLSDSVEQDKYSFPFGSVVDAGGYLVVHCSTDAGEGYAPFGLSREGGESIVLKTPDGAIADIMDTVSTAQGQSIALNEAGTWQLCDVPSPGFPNRFTAEMTADNSAVFISEFMSSNRSTLADAFGNFSDWVELRNDSDEAVDLTGWFLSDDPADPTKWKFPSAVIPAGQSLVVFCSGQDTQEQGQLHTNFSLSSDGETLVLSTPLGAAADSVTYLAAQPDVAYGCKDREAAALLFPTPGFENSETGYEVFSETLTPSGRLAIWEVMSANDYLLPQSNGDCYDWVELKNISDTDINLADYRLTNRIDCPERGVLPDRTLAPGQTVTVILSGNPGLSSSKYPNLGFSVSAAGDSLYLLDTDGQLSDYVCIPHLPHATSYGRLEGRGGFFHMSPTPGAGNAAGCRLVSDEPAASLSAGVHVASGPQVVSLSSPGTVYYTTDGSDPTTASSVYTGPLNIGSNTILRAIALEDGKMQSDIYTATFLIGEQHSLPVVSLVTDPGNLWGSNGIYAYYEGVKEEKRTANLSYSGPDGEFSKDCEISMHGTTSLVVSKKRSFTVRFRNEYEGPLNFDLFENGDVTTFSSLLLRADVEDLFASYMRDYLPGHIASECSDSMPASDGRFVVLYINGEYWGLYNLREHHSEEHFANHWGVSASTVSMAKKWVPDGTSLAKALEFCEDHTLADPADYAYICSVIDVNSFADWIIFQAYFGNFDINGNMRYYYCSLDGLWRCGLTDLDMGMFRPLCFENVANALQHGTFVRALYTSPEFQDLILKRTAELLDGPLSDEAMLALIDETAEKIRPEIARERERWGSVAEQWEGMVQDLKDFCTDRAESVEYSICYEFALSAEKRASYFG